VTRGIFIHYPDQDDGCVSQGAQASSRSAASRMPACKGRLAGRRSYQFPGQRPSPHARERPRVSPVSPAYRAVLGTTARPVGVLAAGAPGTACASCSPSMHTAYPAATRSPASTSRKPSTPATGPPLAHKKAAQTPGIPSVMRPCHSWTQRDTAGPGASTQIRLDVLDLRKCRLKTLAHRPRPRAGRSRAPRSTYAADQPGSGPPLAHSNRERSTGPLPDTCQTRHPGTPEAGLTWGFVWQVLGSNQRRLSRRFYRPFLPNHRDGC
jgi:hypothetical protein